MSQIVLPQSSVLPADPPVDAYLDALLGRPSVPVTSAQATADAQSAHAPEPAGTAGARDPRTAPEMAAEPPAAGKAEVASGHEPESEPESGPQAQSVPQPAPAADAAPAADGQAAAMPYSPPLAVPSVRAAPPPIGQRWLRVAIGNDRYAVELLRVQEVVRLAPIIAMRGAPPSLLGVMNLRGRVVPVHDLGRWLRRQPAGIDERTRIVVLEHHDELAGLLVSAVTDVVTLEARQIEPPAASLRDRTSMGIARTPGAPPTVLLDATAVFE
ncbi:chemotaxis protein CheW [Thermomonas sp.]|uniref:chemotaxis protein CheW n=1 Tax=Thermomonas sp. TaxID=1971895 RepID=UPI003D0A059E